MTIEEIQKEAKIKYPIDPYMHESGLHNTIMMKCQESFISGYETAKKHWEPTDRFKMPTDEQLTRFCLVVNEGKIELEKLTDMFAVCQVILNRLYDNGDLSKKSKYEIELES